MRKAPVPSFLRVLTLGCLLAAAVGVGARPALAVTLFTVNSAGDGADSNLRDNLCDDGTGHCTLRAAIQQANSSAGAQTIDFNILTRPRVTPVIKPASPLPAVSGQTVIDGTSQPSSGHVILDGSTAGSSATGFGFTGASSTLRGFTVQAFGAIGVFGQAPSLTIAGNVIGSVTGSGGNNQGIVSAGTNAVIGGSTAADRNVISGNALNGIVDEASGDTIQGNYIGTTTGGTAAAGNAQDGISVFSSNATIGPGNVISGNGFSGVEFRSSLAHNDTLKGNLIGTNAAGSAALPNQLDGVRASLDAHDNAIGVAAAGGGNVISGNHIDGVRVAGSTSTGNSVQGNLIGTDASGTAAIANQIGVEISDVSGIVVGGTTPAARNVISGNVGEGVRIQQQSSTTSGNVVQGNFIGTNAAGTGPIPNQTGVLVFLGDANSVGGAAAGAGNVISGNLANGVLLGSNNDSVVGNLVGTDATGTSAIGNGSSGISVDSSANAISGNLVSGNVSEGISLNGDQATGNTLTGNLIGTDAAGAAAVPNGNGIFVDASNNHIGGAPAADRNVISGNGGTGIVIDMVTSSTPPAGNTVEGNYVGVAANGSAPLGNQLNGILVFQAGGNTIGGTDPGTGNVISANARGLYVSTSGPGTVVYGNLIGTNAAGTSTSGFGNAGPGIRVENTLGTTIGGTTATTRNVISGNGAEGIDLEGSTGTAIVGNYIGTDLTGTLDLGNVTDGVLVSASPKNTIGGASPGQGNVISGNDANGVRVTVNTSKSNKVLGNLIGTQKDGASALGNTGNGVLIDGKAGKTTVGGSGTRANVIADNGSAGVFVDSGKGNAIRQNSIYANGALGIDLHPAGVNPNDPGDPDTGANLGQNYPVVTSAVAGGGVTTVAGTLNSTANATFSVDVFWGPARDPSLFGEGQTFLGTLSVTTDGSGNATFSAPFSGAIPAGSWVTMTATDATGNTSEFSKAKQST